MIEQIFWKLYFIFYYFLVMWNLISTTGTEPVFPTLEVWNLNYWAGREVPRKRKHLIQMSFQDD